MEAWGKSKSKAILRRGLLCGEITYTMKPEAVYQMHPEHAQWKNKEGWKDNFRNLKKQISRERARMVQDVGDYGHDMAIIKRLREENGEEKIPWHRSRASRLLKQDVRNGKHLTMKPEELYHTRPEYYEHFKLEVFRKHIYQEVDSIPKREIRFLAKQLRSQFPELLANHPRLQKDK